jgi:hypothetical protein
MDLLQNDMQVIVRLEKALIRKRASMHIVTGIANRYVLTLVLDDILIL